MTTQIAVLAHNEERRIALCLDSLPQGEAGIAGAVVVNGSSDATAQIVRTYADRGVRLVEYAAGGKARSWKRFVLDEAPEVDSYVLVDGDPNRCLGRSRISSVACMTIRAPMRRQGCRATGGRRPITGV